MKYGMIALAGLVLFSTMPKAAFAQENSFDRARLITSFTQDDLLAAINEAGAQVVEDGRTDVFFPITYYAGGFASFSRAACTDDTCLGLTFMAVFERPAGIGENVVEERVRQFNINYAAASAVRQNNGNYLLKHYLIADGGITAGNLVDNLLVFEDMMDVFDKTFYAR